jgi:hypothetical protein
MVPCPVVRPFRVPLRGVPGPVVRRGLLLRAVLLLVRQGAARSRAVPAMPQGSRPAMGQ